MKQICFTKTCESDNKLDNLATNRTIFHVSSNDKCLLEKEDNCSIFGIWQNTDLLNFLNRDQRMPNMERWNQYVDTYESSEANYTNSDLHKIGWNNEVSYRNCRMCRVNLVNWRMNYRKRFTAAECRS